MQTSFMAIEQEAIAWLLAIAFNYSSWGVRHPDLSPWAERF
jgi:hypothetical protein